MMDAEGIILYIKIDDICDKIDSIGKTKSCLEEYTSVYEQLKNNLMANKYVSYYNSCVLRMCSTELQDALSQLNILKNTLNQICDDYLASNKNVLSEYDMGNLYAHVPFYKTDSFKICIGVAVVAVTVITVAIVAPEVLAVCGEALAGNLTEILGVNVSVEALETVVGAKAAKKIVVGVVWDGIFSGIEAVFEGDDFLHGFMDNFAEKEIFEMVMLPFSLSAKSLIGITGSVMAKIYIGLVDASLKVSVKSVLYEIEDNKSLEDGEYLYDVIGTMCDDLTNERKDGNAFIEKCKKYVAFGVKSFLYIKHLSDTIDRESERINAPPNYVGRTSNGKKCKTKQGKINIDKNTDASDEISTSASTNTDITYPYGYRKQTLYDMTYNGIVSPSLYTDFNTQLQLTGTGMIQPSGGNMELNSITDVIEKNKQIEYKRSLELRKRSDEIILRGHKED